MAKGRPPKSIEQHKRDGTFRPCRHDHLDATEQRIGDEMKCPSHLKGIARNHWTKMAKYLADLGSAKASDWAALEVLCVTYEAMRHVAKALKQFPNDKEVISNYSKLTTTYRLMLVEFGLTPAARSKVLNGIKANNDEKDKPSPFAELLRSRMGHN